MFVPCDGGCNDLELLKLLRLGICEIMRYYERAGAVERLERIAAN